jgi:hypothetical protein
MTRTIQRLFLTFSVIGLVVCLADFAIADDQPQREFEREESRNEPITGTWWNLITPYNCSTGTPAPVSFPALASYSGGGTSLSMGSSAPPASRTHVLGAWTKTGRRTYKVVGLAFLFDPTGVWTGTQRISNTLRVGNNSDRISGTTLVEIFDTQGNPIPNAGACANLVGERVQ